MQTKNISEMRFDFCHLFALYPILNVHAFLGFARFFIQILLTMLSALNCSLYSFFLSSHLTVFYQVRNSIYLVFTVAS